MTERTRPRPGAEKNGPGVLSHDRGQPSLATGLGGPVRMHAVVQALLRGVNRYHVDPPAQGQKDDRRWVDVVDVAAAPSRRIPD